MSDFGVLSLLPPLIAIILAIWTKRVILALFSGVWIGGVMVSGWNPITGTTQTLQWILFSVTSAWKENGNIVTDLWNTKILLFDFLIGAGVGLIYKSGGAFAIGQALANRVRTSRGASILGWLLGVLIFFDDYTNTIIVGNTMRPITDRARVSREMLAYIDDSTAAPVAGLAVVSTWIGYEVGLIGDSFSKLQNADLASVGGAYGAWMHSVPYRFYSILAIILVLIVAYTHRHYGSMLHAEYRTRTENKVLRDGASPMMTTEADLGMPKDNGSAHFFIWPLLTLIFATLYGMWYTGGGTAAYAKGGLMGVLGNSDSALALLWGSFAMVVVAFILVVGTKKMTIEEAENAMVRGMKQMVIANTILVMAWSIKQATDAVGTAPYIVSLAKAAGVSGSWIPLIVFLIAMFISFTTGTSWGTFSIMLPIAIPLTYGITGRIGPELFASIGAVFAGGIFGDHCSPISDTTIMSSMFSGSDHIDHVRTQVPYAMTASGVGIVLYLLFGLGIHSWAILLPVGFMLLVGVWYLLSEWYGRRYGIPHGRVPVYVVDE